MTLAMWLWSLGLIVYCLGFAWWFTRARYREAYDRGWAAGAECVSRVQASIFARGMLPLLRELGATPGQIMRAMAVREDDVGGCGSPFCKACAKRNKERRAN